MTYKNANKVQDIKDFLITIVQTFFYRGNPQLPTPFYITVTA